MLVNGKCILSNSITEKHPPCQLMGRITQLLEDDNTHSKFKSHVEQLTLKDSTLKFGTSLYSLIAIVTCLCTWLSEAVIGIYVYPALK